MFDIDSKIEDVTIDDEGVTLKHHDGSEVKVTEYFIQFINKYGDMEIIDTSSYQYRRADRPTYDELYEHWLKTK